MIPSTMHQGTVMWRHRANLNRNTSLNPEMLPIRHDGNHSHKEATGSTMEHASSSGSHNQDNTECSGCLTHTH